MIRRLVLAVMMATLVSCRTPPPEIPQTRQSLPEFPHDAYRPAKDEHVYRIDSDHSRADIVVRRGGKLARFGHDHVISATRMEGYVLVATDDPGRSHADVRLSLDSLVVDDPAIREQFALDTHPTTEDIEKTTENMRGKVLQTEFWPQVHMRVDVTGGTREFPTALLTLNLHGQEHSLPIGLELRGIETTRLQVSGTFSFLQSDFGIEPFSILGGGLQVLDPVEVTFHLLANRIFR